jgi:hypothetical protein
VASCATPGLAASSGGITLMSPSAMWEPPF